MEDAGDKIEKLKVTYTLETPESSSVFNLPPQQVGLRNWQTPKFYYFEFQQRIVVVSVQNSDDFIPLERKEVTSAKSVDKIAKFFSRWLFSIGIVNSVFLCVQKNISWKKSCLKKWKNYKYFREKSEKMFEHRKKKSRIFNQNF